MLEFGQTALATPVDADRNRLGNFHTSISTSASYLSDGEALFDQCNKAVAGFCAHLCRGVAIWIVALLSAVLLLTDGGVAQSQESGAGYSGAGPLSIPYSVPTKPFSALTEPRRTFKLPKIEKRVESTALGFEQSVAPGPGRKVTFQGKQYRVAEVEVAGGGPMLFANHYVIGVEGSHLIVSLRKIDASDEFTN